MGLISNTIRSFLYKLDHMDLASNTARNHQQVDNMGSNTANSPHMMNNMELDSSTVPNNPHMDHMEARHTALKHPQVSNMILASDMACQNHMNHMDLSSNTALSRNDLLIFFDFWLEPIQY